MSVRSIGLWHHLTVIFFSLVFIWMTYLLVKMDIGFTHSQFVEVNLLLNHIVFISYTCAWCVSSRWFFFPWMSMKWSSSLDYFLFKVLFWSDTRIIKPFLFLSFVLPEGGVYHWWWGMFLGESRKRWVLLSNPVSHSASFLGNCNHYC